MPQKHPPASTAELDPFAALNASSIAGSGMERFPAPAKGVPEHSRTSRLPTRQRRTKNMICSFLAFPKRFARRGSRGRLRCGASYGSPRQDRVIWLVSPDDRHKKLRGWQNVEAAARAAGGSFFVFAPWQMPGP